ncbi:uncharacterized protein LOC18105215 isoform X2 [Populus trichocarpa]|uniref:uncharacterized protein LOC18105215 isoform X2 n=1 Tax=Populus trichocarpa TaxID=3694 RepID=UPI0022778572|nr:uncharacterized protein LOC18105215 isoform X2 [Populus trichocarpa]
MGGGGAEHGHGAEGAHGDFRAKVWSMSGGPYCRPKHWRRNTAIAMFGVFLICIPIAMKSAELEDEYDLRNMCGAFLTQVQCSSSN